jgi:hypothetical protein
MTAHVSEPVSTAVIRGHCRPSNTEAIASFSSSTRSVMSWSVSHVTVRCQTAERLDHFPGGLLSRAASASNRSRSAIWTRCNVSSCSRIARSTRVQVLSVSWIAAVKTCRDRAMSTRRILATRLRATPFCVDGLANPRDRVGPATDAEGRWAPNLLRCTHCAAPQIIYLYICLFRRSPYIRWNREALERPGRGRTESPMSLLTTSIESTRLTRWNFGLVALTLLGVFAIALALMLPNSITP